MLGDHLQIDGDVLTGNGLPELTDQGSLAEKRQSDPRRAVYVAVKLRCANTSQRADREISGRVKDLSTTGCGLILDYPPRVGDIYRFQVAEESEKFLEGVLGRCVRCHFIDEDIFEAGFQFLTSLRQLSPSNGPL